MRTSLQLTSMAVAALMLTGCGGGDDDFTGAYRYKLKPGSVDLVLNIQGGKVEFFSDRIEDKSIVIHGESEYIVKNDKLLFDYDGSGIVLKRNIDKQSLDCLNCQEVLNVPALFWKRDSEGPYNLDEVAEEKAALKAEQG